MANEYISTIDHYGRLVVPKDIREKLEVKEVVFIYDEKQGQVHLVPVRELSHWKGKMKGILKNFEKTHEADWNDSNRR